ncbi:MAG: hypothetical protein M3N50_05425 [Pseudomonadota bacterium]|nr:hypothetical protein [Pseudomonadota bacterium]
MLDHLLMLLQESQFANWVQATAFPYVITLHSVGLAILAGLLIVMDLRVLGFVRGLPLPAFRPLMTVVWVGFFTNAISGAMLFSVDAKKDYYSTLFRTKLSIIAIGLILGALIKSSVLDKVQEFSAADAQAPARAKVLATLSLFAWLGAIVTGRLLAYFTFGDVGIE